MTGDGDGQKELTTERIGDLTPEQMRIELFQLRDIRARLKLREAEVVEKERIITELETDLHNALVGIYDRDMYIEKLETLLAEKAEASKAQIARIKSKLVLWMRAEQVARLKAIEAFCPSYNTRITLKFDPIRGLLLEAGIGEEEKK